MVSSSRFSSSHRGPLPRKEKIIPIEQLGVEALPSFTDTMEGVLEWLKTERLHKYWPVFSRMNYPTLVGLTESNMDYALNCIGSEPITNGARGRILRCTCRLRERSSRLNSINEETSLDEIASVFGTVATTPLSSTENEPDGVCLVRLFLQKFNQVVGFHGPNLVSNVKLRKALQAYAKRSEVPEADREHIQKLLKNLTLAAKLSTSPKKSPTVCSPVSSPSPSIVSSASLSPQRRPQRRSPFPMGPRAVRPICRRRSVQNSPSTPPPSPAHVEKTPTRCPSREKPSSPGLADSPLANSSLASSPLANSSLASSSLALQATRFPWDSAESSVGGRRPDVETRKAEILIGPSLIYKHPALLYNGSSSASPQPKINEAFNSRRNIDDATFNARITPIDADIDLNKLWGGTTNQVMFNLNVASRLVSSYLPTQLLVTRADLPTLGAKFPR